jgi:hypothetical protein
MCSDLMYKGVIYSKIDISTNFAVHTQNGKKLELLLLHRPDETVKSTLLLCSAVEWTEGVLIVEREIARRGLNTKTTEERFKL